MKDEQIKAQADIVWVCPKCGSDNVSILVWMDANSGKTTAEGPDRRWCDDCQEEIKSFNERGDNGVSKVPETAV